MLITHSEFKVLIFAEETALSTLLAARLYATAQTTATFSALNVVFYFDSIMLAKPQEKPKLNKENSDFHL